MPDIPWTILLLIGLALTFDFLNGFRDGSNIVATMIASRALTGRQALTITAIAEFIGPFLFGVAVATTIGHEVLNGDELRLSVVIAALIAAIGWNIFTWWLGIPSSSSHALVGGLIGAAVMQSGFGVVRLAGLTKVLMALAISPPISFLAGLLVTRLILFLARASGPRINIFFKRGQILTAIFLALSHGTNDAQKTMGIITLGLVTGGVIPTFHVPLWVVAICAAAIAAGTATGDRRLIKTLGGKFYKIRPMHGFNTQVASAGVIIGAALLGGPVSTTQVVSSAIMGVGSAERLSKVRWGTVGQIAIAWLTTIPITAILAALISAVLRSLL
ncbi:MAG: anion permease [Anaerolineae bacterium]